MAGPMHGRGAVPSMKGRMPMKKGVLKRLLKILLTEHKTLLIAMAVCLVVSAVSGSVTGLFLNNVYATLEKVVVKKVIGANEAFNSIVITLIILASIYLVGLVSNFIMQRVGAVLTQTFLSNMRIKCFNKMQKLPIKYFDRKNHGDIMSVYTNDINALRQLVSQS